MTKTIYCPACGNLAEVTSRFGLEVEVRCPSGHGWALLLDMNSAESADGTSIMGFQCSGTPLNQLPDSNL